MGISVVGIFISALFSGVPEKSLEAFIEYLAVFTVFSLAFHLGKKEKKYIKYFYLTLIAFGLGLALYYMYEPLISGNFARLIHLSGPFGWYNQMAAFVSYLLPLPLFLFLTKKRYRIINLILAVIILGILLITYSRASLLSVIVGIIITYTFHFRKKIGKKSILSLFVILVISTPLIMQTGVGQRVASIPSELRNLDSTSARSRIYSYKAAYDMYMDHPLTGTGIGTFGEAHYQYEEIPWLYTSNTHNYLLEILAETGLTGLLPIIIFFAYMGVLSIRCLFNRENDDIYTVSLITAIIIAFSHSMFDMDWAFPGLFILFWFSTGLIMSQIVSNSTKIRKNNLIVSSISLIVLIASICLLYFYRQLSIGTLYYELKEEKQALSYLESSRDLFPYSYTANLYLGNIYQQQNNTENALYYYEKARRYNKFSSVPIYNLGVVYQEIGDNKSAKQLYMIAINKNKYRNINYYKKLIGIYFEDGESGHAQELLETAIFERFPLNQEYIDFRYLYRNSNFIGDFTNLYATYISLLEGGGNTSNQEQIQEYFQILYKDFNKH